jgi:EmrB/QacA subfamily drug resistance transporter
LNSSTYRRVVTELARWGTGGARRVLAAAVLGSAMAFLDGTIVNVAVPAIGADLDAGLAQLQWVLDAYLVTLTALLLLGGSLGDRYGRRRVFTIGVVWFAAASVLCGAATDVTMLIAARALQGVGGALLVPGSLALLSATVHPDDRPRAVGAWSGLTGVASAIGPFAGGWLVDAASWRWAFLVNAPLAVVVVVIARGVPDSVDEDAPRHLDVTGAAIVAAGLGLLTGGLIEEVVAASLAGAALLLAFVVVERRSPAPMLPPSLFGSAQFTGTNLVTLAVYAGLGVAMFLVVVDLQLALGYSALEAGVSLLPITVLMLLLSARAGRLAQRTGPRLPLTAGPLLVAAGMLLLAGVGPGDRYVTSVLPGALVFGLGLSVTVAPLTAAVLAAVDEHHLGVASATNNAVARLAGLLAVAVVPSAAGVVLDGPAGETIAGYRTAMVVAAVLAAAGSVAALATVRRLAPTAPTTQASVLQPCHDPCVQVGPGSLTGS